jgi:hypothetical protein
MVMEETDGDWEKTMEILLGMAGDEKPGTGILNVLPNINLRRIRVNLFCETFSTL